MPTTVGALPEATQPFNIMMERSLGTHMLSNIVYRLDTYLMGLAHVTLFMRCLETSSQVQLAGPFLWVLQVTGNKQTTNRIRTSKSYLFRACQDPLTVTDSMALWQRPRGRQRRSRALQRKKKRLGCARIAGCWLGEAGWGLTRNGGILCD